MRKKLYKNLFSLITFWARRAALNFVYLEMCLIWCSNQQTDRHPHWHRHTHTESDIHIHRLTDRQTHPYTDRQRATQTHTPPHTQSDIETHSQTQRQRDRHTHRQTQTHTHTHTHRQTIRYTDTSGIINVVWSYRKCVCVCGKVYGWDCISACVSHDVSQNVTDAKCLIMSQMSHNITLSRISVFQCVCAIVTA